MKHYRNNEPHRRETQQPYRQNARSHTNSSVNLRKRRRIPFVGIAAVILFALSFTGMFFWLERCSDSFDPNETTSHPPYRSPYDWTGLQSSGDRLAYYEDGVLKSQVGVDVSEHQGSIDWQSAAADGIEFAFVRVGNRGYTEGGLFADVRFNENLEGSQAAGLETGVYFFSQAISTEEAVEEADFVLEQLQGRPLELPVVFDHEPVSDSAGRANNLDRTTLTACALAFCERIEAAGYSTMIYGNAGDIARYDYSSIKERLVWFAEYDAATPHAQFDFVIWQYTNDGRVAGINAAVDLNLRMSDAL